MSEIKTIDQQIKGLAADKQITIYDNFDLHNALFVSSRDKVESIDAAAPSEDKQFQAAAAKIKKLMGDKSAIVAKADATHYGMVNHNFYWYNPSRMRANAKTWIQKTDNGAWGKPVQTDHMISADKTLGRVVVATPFLYPQDSDNLFTADGHIQLIYYVSDAEGIEKIIDGRFRTLSVSSSSSADQVSCSICGRSVASWDCTHTRGKSYALDNEDNKDNPQSYYQKKTKKSNAMTEDQFLAFWMWDKQKYNEVSYVQKPADDGAEHTKLSFINIDGIDASDNIVNEQAQENASIMMMVGNVSNNQITDIKDYDNNDVDSKMLFAVDSIAAESEKEEPEEITELPEHKVEDAAVLDCGCEQTEESDSIEQDDIDSATNTHDETAAIIGLVADMIKTGNIDMKDAFEVLYESNFYISTTDRTPDKMGELLDAELIQRDAKLSTKKRKSLPKVSFCGPDRSFPVPDCAHVTAARRLIGRYKGSSSTKQRIMACVNRKANSMGCGSGKKTKDYTQEDLVVKYTFETEQDLLDSAPVQKAIDAVKTENEQAIDQIKKEADEQVSRFKAIAIDSIITIAIELDKPMVSKLKGKDGDDTTEARKEITEDLGKRSLDALEYTLKDLRAEKEYKEANAQADDSEEQTDENQQAVEDATEAPVGDGKAEDDTQATENNTSEENEAEASDGDTTAPENTNQADGEDEDQAPSVLSSITKPVGS